MISALLKENHIKIPFDHDMIALRGELISQALDFFAKPLAFKGRLSSPDFNHGYRPIGIEYSQAAERPDLNEAFALWGNDADRIPNDRLAAEFVDTLLLYQEKMAATCRTLVHEIKRHYDYDKEIEFEQSSYLQINYYQNGNVEREYLQEQHEDGHLFTLLTATRPGLEILRNGVFTDAPESDNRVLVMPGSILTLMTDGQIEPLFHRVRNSGEERISIMYFVNPDVSKEIEPFVASEDPSVQSIRQAVIEHPLRFGLPTVPHQ